ncbi:ABC transporter ATP-binding protein [Virgibacillus pantothenticus]|uniref:ABC transporter ATP-binding protein n=1 Tax=Virgibacillus TaxID=84406 RepID=UPI00090B45CE|nr:MULTISPECIES: ABC transporter ATP-binding protein [Virgibacillus]API93017.1 multidrug ABC transporter ATP-binding protein [Virgibacillus sp. 6R]MBS7429306.1 ABC transporter ATP-binding protein [Virgibacillus sp. 19R1-5]GIP62894.1 ABC transporter ATP-binding protein [Virgibacillus pantothenticus]
MLVLKDVSKKFGNFTALEDINLEFNNGIYGLLAPNGAGKTTLIKMLVTLLFPTKGEIEYDGTEITSLDEQYRNVLGYLPQEFGYYKNYTSEKYLNYLAALKGLDKKETKKRISELLELVGLGDVTRKKMKKFSGGMIQRVGIAQAVLNDPKILILDEPTAGLDPKERARFRKILTTLARDRIIILSTHIVSDVESIAKEIIMIKNKTILYKDTVANISNTLDGKVFEAEVSFSDLNVIREKYQILSERQEREKMTIRFITSDQTNEKWKRVTPTLEDVFLYVYEDDETLAGSV